MVGVLVSSSNNQQTNPSLFPLSAVVAFAGSRYGSAYPVAPVVAAVLAAGGSIRVGCAKGVDQAVRQADPTAHIIQAKTFGYGKYSFAKRTKVVVSQANALILYPPETNNLGLGSTLALNTALALNLPIWQAGPNPPANHWQPYTIAKQTGYLLLPNKNAIFPV